MTLRGSLAVFAVGTAFAWGAWLLVLFTVEPEATGPIGEIFFFGSLFLALTGTLTILGVLGRMRSSTQLAGTHLAPAFRQGVFIAIAGVGVLFFSRFQILEWWTILLLGGTLIMMDLFFLGRRRRIR